MALPTLFTLGGAAIATVYFISHTTASENSVPTQITSNNARYPVSSFASELTLNKQAIAANDEISANTSSFHKKNTINSFSNGNTSNTLHPQPQVSKLNIIEDNSISQIPSESSSNGGNAEFMNPISSIVRIENSPTKHTTLSNKPLQSPTDIQSSVDFPNTLNFTNTSSGINLPITASLRGLINLSTFPSIAKTSYNNEFNNVAISIGYQINEDISIGVEGGRQSLHYYTFENGKNENATLHTSMDWAGAFYKQQFSGLTYSELTPYAQVTLGGTLSGPSGRLLTGFLWQPDSRISLSAGIEGSAFLYQKSADWYSLRALGFMYQVEVKF
ncbi:MAG: hypothetical protein HYZ54_09170 [Ignavibacteriae bacterium]|nr:hypothetical protein [Ignavibacteriota bacterium]